MTEQEELKAKADQANMVQRVKELENYLDALTLKIEEYGIRVSSSRKILFLCWLLWVALDWVTEASTAIVFLPYLFALVYMHIWETKEHGAMKEFMGVIRTLELLGMIPPLPPRGNSKKKREYWKEAESLVKGWAAKKKQAQEKVYAPA